MQTSLLGIAFGLILAFLAALVGPGLVDWNARKPWIEAEASRLFAVPVTLGGPVMLRLLPIPALELQDVTLGDSSQSIAIGHVYGELRLAPLLRGQIIMERTAFARPVLRLSLPMARDQKASLPNIDDLGILDGTLILVDAKGQETRIEALNLLGESHESGLKLAGKASLAGKATTVSLIYSAPAGQERGKVRLRLERQDAILEADGQWDAAADMPFEGQFSLNMPLSVGRLHFRAPLAASFQRYAMGAGEGDLRQDAQVMRFAAEGELDHDAGRFALALHSRAADADMMTGTLPAMPQMQQALAFLKGADASLALPPNGDLRMQVTQLRLGGAAYDLVEAHLLKQDRDWRLARLATRLPGEGSLLFTGRPQEPSPLTGQLRLDLVRPQALLAALGETRGTATGPVDPLTLEAALTLQENRLLFSNLALATQAGPLTGQIIREDGAHPLWRLDLAARALDLDRLATTLSGFDSVARPRLDVTLAASDVRFRGMNLGELRLSALRQDNMLTLRSLDITAAEGEATLTGALSLATPLKGQLDGRLRLTGAPGPLRRALTETVQMPDQAHDVLIAAGDLLVTGRAQIAGDSVSVTADGLLGDGPFQWRGEQSPGGYPRRSEVIWTRPDLGAALALLTGQQAKSFGPPAVLALATTRKSAGAQDMSFTLKHPALDLTLTGEGDAAMLHSGNLHLRSEDIGAAALALGYLAEEPPGALPLDWQGAWRALPQGFDLSGRGHFDRQPLTLTLSGHAQSMQATLRASTLDASVLASVLLAPALRQPGGRETVLDIGVESLSLFGTPVRDLSLLARGPAERRQMAVRSLRLANGERVSGLVQLTPLASHVALSGDLALSGGRLAAFWPGALGELTATASFGGQGSDIRSLASSLLGTVSLSGKGWSVPGLNPIAFARARRSAEEASDLGRPMDEGRLARIFREEAARHVVLGDLDLRGSINAGLVRLSFPVKPVPGGALTGQTVLDMAVGNLRFEGSILPEGHGMILPRIPATIDMADNLFRSQYGLDDLFGWLTLHLLDREEDRIGMAEADRLERVRQRLRLDKVVRPRSPVRSPERFIPPRL